jgi:hypothetical protein
MPKVCGVIMGFLERAVFSVLKFYFITEAAAVIYF